MLTIAFELDQLRMAHEHIAAADRRVALMRSNVTRQRELCMDTGVSDAALLAAEQALQVFREHERAIQGTLEELRSKRLSAPA